MRMRGLMNSTLKTIAALALISAATAAYAQQPGTPSTSLSTNTSIEQQIEALQKQMNQQREEIDSLREQLNERNQQLRQAQDAANGSQASNPAQSAVSLQAAVGQLKQQNAQALDAIQQSQANIHKLVEHPDALHYKGITISPRGSFVAAETVWRQGATGGGLNTPFTGVPIDHSPAASLSEFNASGRQSRIALKATGKAGDMTLTGYYEMDWLSAGTTSNNNQSNSYTVRQRQLWGQAALNSGWTFTGGQMWSLVTETANGLENGTEVLPDTIDPQYEAGFVWNRQYGFRVTKNLGRKFWIGASAENDQMLVAGNNLPTNELIGSNGTGGGLYNSTATYSYNLAPELVAKIAVQPGWGHWELFGVTRFFHDRVYPASGSPYNDATIGGGIGGGFRGPLFNKKIVIGLKGLYGDGTGRMGSSAIADTTLRPDGQIAPLHAFSALSTLQWHVNKRLMLYANYGGDYVGRRYFGTTGEGYGSPYSNMTGCNTESVPSGPFSGSAPATPANCKGNTKNVQEFTAGDWYNVYSGPAGTLRFGLQYSRFRRDLWSGIGGATNPGGGAHGIDNMFWTSFRYYLP